MSVEAKQPNTDQSHSSLSLYTDEQWIEAEVSIGLTRIILP